MPMDEAADRLFSPRYSPLGFFALWDARGIVPSKGMGETADPEEEIINDDEYSDKGDRH
jgi:hypothetical protein